MFVVLNNDKPASTEGFPELKFSCWKNNKFDTLLEAQEYASMWLRMYAPARPIELNEKYHYSGGSNFVVIREEE